MIQSYSNDVLFSTGPVGGSPRLFAAFKPLLMKLGLLMSFLYLLFQFNS